MAQKTETEQIEKAANVNFESDQIVENHKNIEILKEKRLKEKNDAKGHWQAELVRTRDLNALKP
jgi:hypothetical protein